MSTEILEFVIPLKPVTKKNSQRIMRKRDGTPFIGPSSAYRQYEQFASIHLKRNYAPLRIGFPVNVKCLYYMPTRRVVDLVNLLEATCDVLVHAGILKDDNCSIVVGHDGSRVLYDKENPRTEIYIESVEDRERIFSFPSGEQGGTPPVKSG